MFSFVVSRAAPSKGLIFISSTWNSKDIILSCLSDSSDDDSLSDSIFSSSSVSFLPSPITLAEHLTCFSWFPKSIYIQVVKVARREQLHLSFSQNIAILPPIVPPRPNIYKGWRHLQLSAVDLFELTQVVLVFHK
eukprot:UN30851